MRQVKSELPRDAEGIMYQDRDDVDICPECGRALDEWSECQICISGDERYPEFDFLEEEMDAYPEREEDDPEYAN
jgi:hypothetical protein